MLRAADDDGLSHSAEAIHQEVMFKAPAKRVYDALTDAAQFSLFGGYVTGRQIELVPDQRIVQAWRAGSWQSGAYSIVRFELVDQGGTTKLIFDHAGFPAGTGDHLASGWKEHYWEPMQKFLA